MKAVQESTPSAASVMPVAGTPYYVKACALGIPAYFIGIHLWTWVFMLPVFLGGRADFRQLYAAGYMVRTGHSRELYDYNAQKEFQDRLVSREAMVLPFVRPAYQAVVFVPLSFLPFRIAYVSFLVTNLALLATIFLFLQPWMHNLRAVYRFFPYGLFLGFLPVAAALIQGQDSIILLALLVAAFLALGKGHELAAGILTGLGLFKFQIVIPIAVLFLFWRRLRFVSGFTACGTILVSVSVWLVGIAQAKIYFYSLFSMAGTPSSKTGLLWYPVPAQMMANVRGFVFGVLHTLVPHLWQQILTALLSASIFTWALLRGARLENASGKLLLSICVSLLISYYAFIHDLSILLLPLIVILNASLPSETRHDRTGRLISWSVTLLFVAPILESFVPDHFFLVSVPILLFCTAITVAIPRTETSFP